MKDASVVTQDTLRAVAAEVTAEAADTNVIQSITKREPLLAAYIAEKMLVVSGKLSLAGAPALPRRRPPRPARPRRQDERDGYEADAEDHDAHRQDRGARPPRGK